MLRVANKVIKRSNEEARATLNDTADELAIKTG